MAREAFRDLKGDPHFSTAPRVEKRGEDSDATRGTLGS